MDSLDETLDTFLHTHRAQPLVVFGCQVQIIKTFALVFFVYPRDFETVPNFRRHPNAGTRIRRAGREREGENYECTELPLPEVSWKSIQWLFNDYSMVSPDL